MGQTNNGSTDNATVSQQTSTGEFIFNFNDPFDMLINLNNAGSIIVDGSAKDDKFNLMNSSGLIINGNNGNDIFNIAANQTSLNGNVIHGGTGYNFITITGSNTNVDLTGSSQITAVVGNFHATGESVNLSFNQIAGSALKNGTNRAFAAVIGSDGKVNLSVGTNIKFVGSLNGANQGFDASGNAITGAALTALQGEVTSDAAITGNLAALYAAAYSGNIPANETEVKNLNAYVFTDGSKYYTLWSDGTVTTTDTKGNAATYYQPAATASSSVTYAEVSMFSKSGTWAGANVYTDAKGNPDLQLVHGSSTGTSAINLTNGVTGTAVHGDNGANGVNYFGLGGSGGNNHVYASPVGAVFDLQNSTALQDVLVGGKGFDVVQVRTSGADVDLTANNAATSTASTAIDAVVAAAAAVKAGATYTVELDVTSLKTTKNAAGVLTAEFEAMLGSASDTLTLSSAGKGLWLQVGSFAPGSAAPTNAAALANGAQLDALFGKGTYTAENALTGYLFEKLDAHNHVTEYLTIYTDATIVNTLSAPATAVALDYHL